MNWLRTLAVSKRVVRSVLHDRRFIGLVFFMPIFSTGLVGYAFQGRVVDLPVAVIVEPQEPVSAYLPAPLGRLSNADFSRFLVSLYSQQEQFDIKELTGKVPPGKTADEWARELVRTNRYRMVMVLDRAFNREFLMHFIVRGGARSAGEVRLYVDESDPQIVAAIHEGLTSIMKGVGKTFASQMDVPEDMRGGLESGVAIHINYEELHGTGTRIIDAFAPSIMGLVLSIVAPLFTMLTVVREKETGTRQRILVSPTKPWEYVAGLLIPWGALSLIISAELLIAAKLFFNILVRGSLLQAGLVLVLYTFTMVGAGLVLSAVARNEFQVILFLPLLLFPALFLSGTIWPFASIPSWLRPVAYAVPLTYANQLLRGIMLRGNSIGDLPLPLGVLVAITCLLVSISILRVSRKAAG